MHLGRADFQSASLAMPAMAGEEGGTEKFRERLSSARNWTPFHNGGLNVRRSLPRRREDLEDVRTLS